MPLIPLGIERPIVIGHRGSRAKNPENTILSFQAALDEGALGLETDLHFTKDEHLVCFHDATLDRMTNSKGLIRDHTLAELKDVDILHDKFSPQKIPTFKEFLDWLPNNIGLVLELKDEKFKDDHWTKKMVEVIAQYNVANRTAIISFKRENISSAKRVIPEIHTGFVTYYNLSPNQQAELLGPLFPVLWLNPNYVNKAHKLGKLIAPLDPWPDKRMKYYMRWGIDAVISDNPEKTVRTIARIRNGMEK